MKKIDEDLQAKFTDILKEDENIIGYFSAYNNESKMDTGNMFDVFVKKDKYYFAVKNDGLHMLVEKDSRASEYSYSIKSGYYSWDSIKEFTFHETFGEQTIIMKFADGKDLLVFITQIDENTNAFLLTKKCEPDSNDIEFQNKRKEVEKNKSRDTLIGIVVLIIIIILFSFMGKE
jgi:hypothetical protein